MVHGHCRIKWTALLAAIVSIVSILAIGCGPARYAVDQYTDEDGASVTRLLAYDNVAVEGVDQEARDITATGFGSSSRSEDTRQCCMTAEKRISPDSKTRYYFVITCSGSESANLRSLSIRADGKDFYFPRDKDLGRKSGFSDRHTKEEQAYYRVFAEDLWTIGHAGAVSLTVEADRSHVKGYVTTRGMEGLRRFVDEQVD